MHSAAHFLLKTTPFHERTAPLVRAQTWRRWAGYQIASAYEPHPDREYAAVRNAAALFDVSPLHKYLIGGPHAARLLDRMVTRDVTKCAVGQVLYTPWCDAHGKVIDDGTIHRLDERTYRLTSAEPNLRWLAMNAVGLDVTVEDISVRVPLRWRCKGRCRARSCSSSRRRTSMRSSTSAWCTRRCATFPSRFRAPATRAISATSCGSTPRARCRCGMR